MDTVDDRSNLSVYSTQTHTSERKLKIQFRTQRERHGHVYKKWKQIKEPNEFRNKAEKMEENYFIDNT